MEGSEEEAIGCLAALEIAIFKMITGLFRFIFVQIPTWIYELAQSFFDWLGRALWFLVRFTVRLVRVVLLACVWLAIVFGPLLTTLYFASPSPVQPDRFLGRSYNLGARVNYSQPQSSSDFGVPHIASAGWAAVSLIGSLWGLNRWLNRRRSAARTGDEGRGVGCAGVFALLVGIAVLSFVAWAYFVVR